MLIAWYFALAKLFLQGLYYRRMTLQCPARNLKNFVNFSLRDRHVFTVPDLRDLRNARKEVDVTGTKSSLNAPRFEIQNLN
jgi:hypothetical protein